MSILHVILHKNTDSFKHSSVQIKRMLKSLSQNGKIFDLPIEVFVSSKSSIFEFLDLRSVTWIADAYIVVLITTISTVSNDALAVRNFIFQTIFFLKNCQVCLPSWKRAIQPNKLALKNVNCNLIGHSRPISLVQTPFGAGLLLRLMRSTMHPINSADEDFILLVKCITVSPNNLQKLEKEFKRI